MRRSFATVLVAIAALACGGETAPPAPSGPTLDTALLLSLSPFEVTPTGKVVPKPGAARMEILTQKNGVWSVDTLDDPQSNVFHKAMVYEPRAGDAGILTLGGTKAILKLWRAGGRPPQVLWQKEFGGKWSRMRDAEVADVYGDGVPTLAVATHDQGVVATVRPKEGGGWDVRELDAEKDTFVHEIEIGDLDGDGVLEVYATPSEPNRLDGTPQSGKVTRYVPARNEGRAIAADLGMRHAKEILVGDVDGDGTDELYVAVEGETEGKGRDARLVNPVEIRRYDADTDPGAGMVVATLPGERLTRFLTAGDVDGDGKQEMVAAAFKSGLWLLRPGADPKGTWEIENIDRESSGFEHASLLTDLDGDGKDELYVASDDHSEVRRYTWNGTGFDRETIYERKFRVNGEMQKVKGSAFTWNIMPAPIALLP
jgi:hypothetical protein